MPGPQEFWDGFYTRHTWHEQGPVNRHLKTEVAGLTPGRAVDLGCAEGADPIWLGRQGWHVLGVEASAIAVDRARRHVARLGLTDGVTIERRDLPGDFPSGSFDLVSALFLHSPVDPGDERVRILQRAATAVRPGGHLLVVSHWTAPDWHPGMPAVDHPVNLTIPSPEQTRAALRTSVGGWSTMRDQVVPTTVIGPEGQPGTRQDHILHLRRRPAEVTDPGRPAGPRRRRAG